MAAAQISSQISTFPGFRSNLSHFRFSSRLNYPKYLQSDRRKKSGSIGSSSSPLPPPATQGQETSFTDPEKALLEALVGIQGRGRAASPQQLRDVESAVKTLEDSKGILDPTSSSLIEGRWQLIFTTRPGTSSLIQRTFTGVDFFTIFQEVYLQTDDLRVSNVVKFSDAVGELRVEAVATVENGKRILFRFDRAAFSFKFLPFKVPYPVPFRLLGDEAKGWLDTTYLSQNGNIRISRGSKGTTFVLQKKTESRQRLLAAIAIDAGVEEIVDELVSLNKYEMEALYGEWTLLWSSQTEAESWLDLAAYGLQGSQNFYENARVENLFSLLPWFKIRCLGSYTTTNNRIYNVSVDYSSFLFGIFELPVELTSEFNLELLYIDNKIRITKGYRDIIFIHSRVN